MTTDELKFVALMQLPVEVNRYGFYDIEFKVVGVEWRPGDKGAGQELAILKDASNHEFRILPSQVYLKTAYEGPEDATQYARELAARRILGIDNIPMGLKPA